MTIAIAVGLVILGCLDESGIIITLAFVLALLFGAAYVTGLGWHMAIS